ncbi:hypothetical protein [Natronorubrum daqingense]|uniref:Uncharacterized protein n=1 Tax=Natronorubrum daqingense TaxID=588898 RepID=A0A1N7FZX4_9EURY|nr:hypothetical protein [Natronorubrum daqingense]APX98590.1 hypothetical protein BB347_17985 [Natronorubrum daqingense]SIS05746.1 hypothetical protein SAMN05421809_3609 [Natronorubrum daqingense]
MTTNATQAAVDRALSDCTTTPDPKTETESAQNRNPTEPAFEHNDSQLNVDDDREAIEVLELPDGWEDIDLTAENVHIEGVDWR